MSASYEQVQVESRAQWRAWLAEHAATSPGIWLVTWKRGRGPQLRYDELVEEALCVGWVDSKAQGVDADRTSLLLTPRRKGSGWSRPNKERIERLREAGLMLPAGEAVIAAAVADGSWTKLDAVENLTEPPELTAALDGTAGAREHWDAFPRSAKRAILEWITSAKREPTRAARIATTASEAAAGRRANQWRRD